MPTRCLDACLEMPRFARLLKSGQARRSRPARIEEAPAPAGSRARGPRFAPGGRSPAERDPWPRRRRGAATGKYRGFPDSGGPPPRAILAAMNESARRIEAKRKPETCPKCGAAEVVPIVYGTESPSGKTIADIYAGRVAVGGCIVTDDDPKWRCFACEAEIHRADHPG